LPEKLVVTLTPALPPPPPPHAVKNAKTRMQIAVWSFIYISFFT